MTDSSATLVMHTFYNKKSMQISIYQMIVGVWVRIKEEK